MKHPKEHTDGGQPPRIKISVGRLSSKRTQSPMKGMTRSGCLLHASSRAVRVAAVEPPPEFRPGTHNQQKMISVSLGDNGLNETKKLLRRGVMATSLLSLVATLHFPLRSH
ncbi:hypothetical protein ASF29_12225 [Rhizobium sp. Leaf262]|nr:hypothetical protein ASF29_12225 [Rhizobium sp. Leaf262]